MNRLKKVLSFTFLAAAALGVGVGCLTQAPAQAQQPISVFADYSEGEVKGDTLNNYFSVTGITKDTFFYTDAGNEKFNVKLNTEKLLPDKNTPANFKYAFYPDKTNTDLYYYFQIQNITFSIDGVTIPYSEDFNTGSLIINSTIITSFTDIGDQFTPQTIDFDVKYGTTLSITPDYNNGTNIEEANNNDKKANHATVTLAKFTDSNGVEHDAEGKLEISISYNYCVVTVPQNNSAITEVKGDVITPAPTTVRTLFLNETNYLTAKVPNITYSNFIRNPVNTTQSATHLFNYFYNYTSGNLPYITYDPNFLRLHITKNQNNSTQSATIMYDPEDRKINKDASGNEHIPEFLYDIVKESDGKISIYFNDVGQYGISIDLIHVNQNDKTIYTVDRSVQNQKNQTVYMFGAQAFYSNYSAGTNSFLEFKTIKNHTVDLSADVTSLIGSGKYANYNEDGTHKTDTATEPSFMDALLANKEEPVSTNQTPIRFVYNFSNPIVTVYKLNDAGNDWLDPEDGNITKTYSTEGTYFVSIQYNLSSYTLGDGALGNTEKFYQFFYFKIKKPVPQISVKSYKSEAGQLKEIKELMSEEYTNADAVKITYESSTFDSETRFEIEKYDFTNPGASVSKQPFTFTNGEYTETSQGRYTIYIYYSNNESPTTRSFVIDREPIGNINAFGVQKYGVNEDYRIDPLAIDNITNQSFMLSWEPTKRSGAPTYAYFKHYSLSGNSIYTADKSKLSSMISELLNTYDSMATDKSLQLNTETTWNSYANAYSYLSSTVPSSYIKEDAGLYIFQIFDKAGNSAVKIVLLDDSKPYFAIYTTGSSENGGGGYSLISSYHTISTDATLYWGKNKSIFIGSSEPLSQTNLITDANNNDNKDDTNLVYTELNKFFAEHFRNYSTGSIPDGYKGYYYEVPLDKYTAFKGLDGNYVPLTDATSKEIQSSYKVYYTEDGGKVTNYYYSTTDEISHTFLRVTDNGSGTEKVTAAYNGASIEGEGELKEAKIYKRTVNGEQIFYYSAPIDSDALLHRVYSTQTVAKDANVGNDGSDYKSATFVDMEGTYVFLLRDAANTLGRKANATDAFDSQKFLNYASAFQYVKVTGDSSLTQIYFENANGDSTEQVELMLAAFSESGINDGTSYRVSYYEPTSVQTTLYVSFIPTSKTSTGTTQVDTVTLKYYPYVTKSHAHLDATGAPVLSFYNTLSLVEPEPIVIYNFNGGSGDQASETAVTYAINVSAQMTQAGKYVLERKYIKGEVNGETYVVGSFDYDNRTLTSIVDRYGVISEQSPISFDETTYSYTVNGTKLEVRQLENILEVTIVDRAEFDSTNFQVKIDGDVVEVKQIKGNVGYYICDSITSFEICDASGSTQQPDGPPSQAEHNTLESLIGGDILVNMYEGRTEDDNGSVVAVTFPYYNGLLPSGDSFYTDKKSNWSELYDDPAIRLTTNKLPVALYIPQVKYTLYNEDFLYDKGGDNYAMGYKTNQNPYLTHYDYNAENSGSFITPYEIHAEIVVTETISQRIVHYHSTGATASGFLAFADDNNNQITEFKTAGDYIVTITQGYNSDGSSANNFRKNYKFAFRVESSAPEFSITSNGTPLSSLGDTYYTNSKEVRVTWNDNNSRYMANIDKENISLRVSNTNYIVKIIDGQIEADPVIKNGLFYTREGLQNRLNIQFENFAIASAYTHGSRMSITMQYEKHDSAYYQTTTKNILIDIDADDASVNSLIDKLPEMSNLPLNKTTLRKYLDATGTEIQNGNPDNANFVASYNISAGATSPLYRYSYLVDRNFFLNLRDHAMANSSMTTADQYARAGWGSIEAYYRIVDNPYNSSSDTAETDEETSYSDFVPSSFVNLSENVPGENDYHKYFEIVERDRAGNMTIYLVYLCSQDEGDGYEQQLPEEQSTTIYQGFEIADQGQKTKRGSDAQILTNKLNLYATTNSAFTRFNFMGDAWTRFTFGGQEYMITPLIPQGYAYALPNIDSPVSFASILSNFTSSASAIPITVLNKMDGKWYNFSLTLLDGVDLATSLSNSDTEYISIGYTNSVFPVDVKIYAQTALIAGANPIAILNNDPNLLNNLRNNGYSYSTGWQSQDGITVTISQGRILFTFSTPPTVNTKIRYEITDNFGNLKKVSHVFGIVQPEEIRSLHGNIYRATVKDSSTENQLETYYISANDLVYSFNGLINSVTVEKWNNNAHMWEAAIETTDFELDRRSDITTYTFSPASQTVNNKYRLTVNDVMDDGKETFNKRVYFQIYRMLPYLLGDGEDASEYLSIMTFVDSYGANVTKSILTDEDAGTVNINGKIYSITAAGVTFASRITLAYTNPTSSNLFDYRYSVYVYREDGAYGSDFAPANSGAQYSQSGIYYFLVKYDNYDDILRFEERVYRVEILDSNHEFYRVSNNGQVVKRAGSYYNDGGVEYPEYYIVNVRYPDESGAVTIIPNTYQEIDFWQDGAVIPETDDFEVNTLRYRVTNTVDRLGNPKTLSPGVQRFDKFVYITFVPPTNEPVNTMYLTYTFSEQFSMARQNSLTLVPDDEGIDSVKLVYSKDRGIESNKIEILVLKDGVEYTPVKKQIETREGEFNYIELFTSGTYTISFRDTSGNRHLFASGTNQQSYEFNLTFLKDVSFFMSFTDAEGNEQTTDPIQKGVFNNSVTLSVIKSIGNRSYYVPSSIGSVGDLIHAKKNGVDYTGYTYEITDNLISFAFTEPGYYTVSFSALSLATTPNLPLREIEYSFTIVNPNESRYSFEFSPYQSYYIKSIVKDNLNDITRDEDGNLLEVFAEAFQTTTIDGKQYLRNLLTSIISQIGLGQGRYTVTISTGKNLNRDDYSKETTFSFDYWINATTVPIDVSLNEGDSTSKNIRISFNAERVFNAVGECVVYIGSRAYQITSENIVSLGTVNESISVAGTHYITVMSMSGSVLYRYKVTKTEPLNGWAIAAIVIGAIVLVAVIIIIVKLRKRIKVK